MALKKVRADAMDEDSISFLCREINILRSLDHPNIMKLLNVATTSEKATIFLVFEYLEHDLAGLCRLLGGPLTEEQASPARRALAKEINVLLTTVRVFRGPLVRLDGDSGQDGGRWG